MNIQRFIEALREGCIDPVHAARYHGGGKKGGDKPDYRGAAIEEAQAGKQNLTQQTWANRPTINTPFGQQSWDSSATVDPATGQPVTQWTQNTTLSPEAQSALDAQQRIQQGRSGAAETLLGQATGAFQTPFDWNSLPDKPGNLADAQSGAYERMRQMLEPGRTQQQATLDTKLANMGLPMGSEAGRRANMQLSDQFGAQDRQMLGQAMQEGRSDISAQQTQRGAAIAEEAQRRGMSLNELNALLTGQQVSMPSMPGFQNAGVAQAPQLSAALQQQTAFNQSQGPDIGQLVGTGASLAAMM